MIRHSVNLPNQSLFLIMGEALYRLRQEVPSGASYMLVTSHESRPADFMLNCCSIIMTAREKRPQERIIYLRTKPASSLSSKAKASIISPIA